MLVIVCGIRTEQCCETTSASRTRVCSAASAPANQPEPPAAMPSRRRPSCPA